MCMRMKKWSTLWNYLIGVGKIFVTCISLKQGQPIFYIITTRYHPHQDYPRYYSTKLFVLSSSILTLGAKFSAVLLTLQRLISNNFNVTIKTDSLWFYSIRKIYGIIKFPISSRLSRILCERIRLYIRAQNVVIFGSLILYWVRKNYKYWMQKSYESDFRPLGIAYLIIS